MDGTGTGIYLAHGTDRGDLEIEGLAIEAPSPSFLAQRGDHVYAALEGAGRVESFAVVGDSLVRDGAAPSGGTWPCQLEFLDRQLVAANYFTGTLGVVGLDAAGAVAALGQVVQDSGSGPRAEQDGPHAHAAFRVDEHTLLGLDLGSDRIEVHSIGTDGLVLGTPVVLAAGTGPRDIARHSSGLLYVLGELSGELLVFKWSGGVLDRVASVPLPGADAGDHASGISFGPGGFVYVGLRGSQRISVLHASTDGRAVEPIGSVSSEGDWPRHHAVDGDLLHVANQQSDSIASFRLGGDGIPRLVADPVPVPAPTFLLARRG